MTKEEQIKELEIEFRDALNPFNDDDTEYRAWRLVEIDGWRKQIEAEWIKMEYSDDYKCSHCTYIHCDGEELRRNPRHFLYCGHCGAKMKLKEE